MPGQRWIYVDIENTHPWNSMHGAGLDIFKIHPRNVPSPAVAAPRAVYQAELVTDGLLANEGLLHKQGKLLLTDGAQNESSLFTCLMVIGCPNCLQVIDTNPNAHKWTMKLFGAFQSLFLFLMEIFASKSS